MKHTARWFLSPLGLTAIALVLGAPAVGAGFQTLDFPGATATRAVDINASGQIVGFYYDADGGSHGFLYEPWKAETYTAIDYPGADWSEATGINQNGDIVGYYGYDTENYFHGFLLTAEGTFSSFDRGGRWSTMPQGISDEGAIVGCAHNSGSMFGWVLQGGTFGSETRGESWTGYAMYTGINGWGTLVGWYWTGNRTHSFVLDGTGRADFRYPGARNTQAWGVNSAGDVVGWYGPRSSARGFLLRQGLLSEIHVADADWTVAYGINDGGDIVGAYRDAFGTHGLLLSAADLDAHGTHGLPLSQAGRSGPERREPPGSRAHRSSKAWR